MKKLKMDPREQIPFNFLFRGPPGSGKTSTARRMGKIFYDMGFLATAKVVECSSTDLVGQFVGQTDPKTQNLLTKALGKVLFIDEAYRLTEGNYAQEAMDELVDYLTKPKFSQKLIVILAGYDENINRLISTNPGLTSRFPDTISFGQLPPENCLELLQAYLRKAGKLESSTVQAPSTTFRNTLLELFRNLAQLRAWANARDVKTLAKSIIGKVLSSTTTDTKLEVTEDTVLSIARQMVSEREHRASSVRSPGHPAALPTQNFSHQDPPIPPAFNTVTKATAKNYQSVPPQLPEPSSQNIDQENLGRDPTTEREKLYLKLLTQEEEAQKQLTSRVAAELEARRRADEESDAEARRMLEEERLKREHELREQIEIVARIEQEKKARQQERRKEDAVQAKVKQMGVCVVGFR
ncbi:hypothetical protein LTR84_005309 [Exophiala bonariae]|uniref:AAA+ ATPase domain-containing protein n=1 Tax=Exophiala bonariae TaxID=1690606 RepID=A0AAV9N3M9_9EURO|nr:hypothetical protein LTR84_005309 [Exophiala bonariae]